MIKNKMKFMCPEDKCELEWPAGLCQKCNRRYLLASIENSILSPGSDMKIYDFRESSKNIEKDRKDLEAHLKIIEGLFHFEDEKLSSLNYSMDINRIAFGNNKRNLPSRAKTLAKYVKTTLRNYQDLLRFFYAGNYSKKRKASDSVQSSLLGYSKTYEMISSFVEPSWLGFLDGKITIDGVIQHHYDNMKILSGVLKNWGCREILEFGLGSGVNLLLLSKFLSGNDDLKLSGFDYPVARLLTAKATVEKHRIPYENLFLANGLNLPLKDSSYDVVFSHYVIEQMKGNEEKALDNMIRVARKGVVLFETAVFKPTFDQLVYMKHSGYSRDLPKVVRNRKDVEIVEMRNIKSSRFYGCPNVLFALKKK
jgi:ubiquinone/menaquinone biosynthesis C-methylase UbiE